jgi:hypothetical protein
MSRDQECIDAVVLTCCLSPDEFVDSEQSQLILRARLEEAHTKTGQLDHNCELTVASWQETLHWHRLMVGVRRNLNLQDQIVDQDPDLV